MNRQKVIEVLARTQYERFTRRKWAEATPAEKNTWFAGAEEDVNAIGISGPGRYGQVMVHYCYGDDKKDMDAMIEESTKKVLRPEIPIDQLCKEVFWDMIERLR